MQGSCQSDIPWRSAPFGVGMPLLKLEAPHFEVPALSFFLTPHQMFTCSSFCFEVYIMPCVDRTLRSLTALWRRSTLFTRMLAQNSCHCQLLPPYFLAWLELWGSRGTRKREKTKRLTETSTNRHTWRQTERLRQPQT